MNINKIFVSMDGILTNFLYGALKKLDRLDIYNSWPLGLWDISEVLGIEKKTFWNIIDEDAFEFWSTLPAAINYLDICSKLERTADNIGAKLYVCTNPTLNAESIRGKVVWLQNAFYHNFTQYIVTPRKQTVAAPDSILLDTSENSIQTFIQHGGHGILYPNIDNRYKCYITDELLDMVIHEINHIARGGIGG